MLGDDQALNRIIYDKWAKSVEVCKLCKIHMLLFVKLEELHIATARKPLFHQTQPVACCQHRNQPCML